MKNLAFPAIGFVILAIGAGTANARPDLSISSIRFNGGIYSGGPCNQVVVTVRNSQMTGVSSPVRVDLQVPSHTDGAGLATWSAELPNGIGPNASLPVTFNNVMVFFPASSVRATVDPANAIAETTTSNNMRTQDAVVSHGACPKVRISDASGLEGDRLTFQVSLDRPFVRPVTFQFRTINGTATGDRFCTIAGTDFIRRVGPRMSSQISPGAVDQQVSIQTCADDITERAETFEVELYNVNSTVDRGRATGTILDRAILDQRLNR